MNSYFLLQWEDTLLLTLPSFHHKGGYYQWWCAFLNGYHSDSSIHFNHLVELWLQLNYKGQELEIQYLSL